MKRTAGVTITEALLATALTGLIAAGTLTQLETLESMVLNVAETICTHQTQVSQVISDHDGTDLQATKADWAPACTPPSLADIAERFGITIDTE